MNSTDRHVADGKRVFSDFLLQVQLPKEQQAASSEDMMDPFLLLAMFTVVKTYYSYDT